MELAGRPLSESDPRRVGTYEIRAVLGEGGMGVVYLADQRDLIPRRVAIKVLGEHQSESTGIARFRQEMEALARLVHPGIARIYESGHLEDGRPFYVMEFIAGEAITCHCDQRRLDLRDRLVLFLQVCAAVQHAHQKGIVHRDLKATNVLVTDTGTGIETKLIDFGLAKVRKTESPPSPLTEVGTILGTLESMSPEQARGSADVDSRSDIFGLGVILYEVLVGAPPRPVSPDVDPREVLRRAQQVEPQAPSTRVGSAGLDWDAISALRRTTARGLARSLRGDLDCIVVKALKRNPDERYETAAELAADIRRHLRREPVAAHPRNPGYIIRKVLLRDRVVAWAVTMIIVGVAAAASVTTSAIYGRVRRNESRVTLIRISERIHNLASVSHLKLEEALASQTQAEDEFEGPIDQAARLSQAALEGRPTAFGAAQATGTAAEGFRRVAELLRDLSARARERLATRNGESSSAEIYRRYHTTYADILGECVALAAGLGSAAATVSVGEALVIATGISVVLVAAFLLVRRLAQDPA